LLQYVNPVFDRLMKALLHTALHSSRPDATNGQQRRAGLAVAPTKKTNVGEFRWLPIHWQFRLLSRVWRAIAQPSVEGSI
jgi:hypothetical protein